MMVEDKKMKYPAEIMVFTYQGTTQGTTNSSVRKLGEISCTVQLHSTHCTQINIKIISIEICNHINARTSLNMYYIVFGY